MTVTRALDRPDLIDHLVFAGGASFDPSGVHPELAALFEAFDPHELDRTQWHEAYRQVAPDPDACVPVSRADMTHTIKGEGATTTHPAPEARSE